MPTTLGYLLTDPRVHFVWSGPGLRRIEDTDILSCPRWQERRDAARAASALNRVLNLRLMVVPLTLPKR